VVNDPLSEPHWLKTAKMNPHGQKPPQLLKKTQINPLGQKLPIPRQRVFCPRGLCLGVYVGVNIGGLMSGLKVQVVKGSDL